MRCWYSSWINAQSLVYSVCIIIVLAKLFLRYLGLFHIFGFAAGQDNGRLSLWWLTDGTTFYIEDVTRYWPSSIFISYLICISRSLQLSQFLTIYKLERKSTVNVAKNTFYNLPMARIWVKDILTNNRNWKSQFRPGAQYYVYEWSNGGLILSLKAIYNLIFLCFSS